MRFSCAPLERGGHNNKGSEYDLPIHDNASEQYGQRPYAEWRQRQLQTLVRRHEPVFVFTLLLTAHPPHAAALGGPTFFEWRYAPP
jgi:hypothetical protein